MCGIIAKVAEKTEYNHAICIIKNMNVNTNFTSSINNPDNRFVPIIQINQMDY